MDKEFDDFHKKCKREEKKVQRDWKKVDVESLKKRFGRAKRVKWN